MSDLADILWQQFGTETGEHLDLAERALAGDDAAGEESVATLFRAVHSIKGLAAAMGVQQMEIIAHSGESLLAAIRDGVLPLDAARHGLLVEVVDVLRTMAEEALPARADVAPRAELQRRLEDATAGARTTRVPRGAPAASGIDATDGRLHAVGAQLAAMMADLVEALRPGAPAEALRRLDGDLVALDDRVGALGFQGLRRQIRHLSRAVHGGRPDLALLHDLALALGVLEEMTGEDAGRRALAAHVAQSGAGDLVRACARAGETLRMSDAGRAEADDASGLIDHAAQRADLLALERSAALLRLALDLLRRGALPEQAAVPLVGVLDAVVEAAAADPPADVEPGRAAHLEEMMRALVAGRGIEATIERALALGVGRALLEMLTDDAREALARAIDDPGMILVELDADLDSDPALAEAVAAWIADNADPVTSRVVLRDGRPHTRLLLATPARPAAVLADLGALDRGGDRLKVAIRDGRDHAVRPDARGPGLGLGDDTLRVPARLIDDILERLADLMPVAAGLESLVASPALLPREREAMLRGERAELSLEAVVDRADERHEILRRLSDTLARALKGLRESALELRIVPVELLFGRYPRLVRELARAQGKQIVLTLEPNGARIDKSMIERLADPLMHMIRNAVDHGVESPEERAAAGKPAEARLVLRAGQRGEHVTITLSDDGRGIDVARVRTRAIERGLLSEEQAAASSDQALRRLVFEPGFSTVAEVTHTSGRGVGMDVVATTAAELGGSVSLESEPGEGTRIALELPLSVAIQSTLLIEQSGQVFALPDRHVGAVAAHPGGAVVALPGMAAVPVVPLASLLGLPPAGRAERQVVVIATGTRRLGLAVERVLRRADILVRESHPAIAAIPGLGGASRLADGSIVLILDPDGLIGLAGA